MGFDSLDSNFSTKLPYAPIVTVDHLKTLTTYANNLIISAINESERDIRIKLFKESNEVTNFINFHKQNLTSESLW